MVASFGVMLAGEPASATLELIAAMLVALTGVTLVGFYVVRKALAQDRESVSELPDPPAAG